MRRLLLGTAFLALMSYTLPAFGTVTPVSQFRRVQTFALYSPSEGELAALLLAAHVAVEELDVNAIYAAVTERGLGHADVCAALDRVRKDHVLTEAPIDTARIVDAVARRARVLRTEVRP